MPELLVILLIFLPLIVATGASIVTWRLVHHRVLFLCTNILLLLGLQGIIAPVATAIFLPGSTLSQVSIHAEFIRGIALSAALITVVGIPLIWRLSIVFRKL